MSVLATIRRDVTLKFGGELASRILFLLFSFYVGRRLGSAEFGTYNVAVSMAYIAGVIFLDTGFNLPAVQLLVSEQDRRPVIASTVFTAKLILFLPMCLVLWGLRHFLGPDTPAMSLLLVASIYILGFNLLEYFSSVTNAFHRMEIEAGLKIFNRTATVIVGYFAVRTGRVEAVLGGMAAVSLLASSLGLLIVTKRLVRVRLLVDWALLKRVFWMGVPIAGTLVLGTLYMKWDLLILAYFNISKEQIGWYAGSFEIVEAFSALPSLLGAALFPMMVQLLHSNKEAMNRLLMASTKAVLLFSVPAAVTVSLLSRQIILLVYGPSYLPAAQVLAVLIWCIVPIFVYFYLVFVNVASGHAGHNLMAGTIAVITGLAANAILVPRIGYIGAAWAALLAHASYGLLATWRVCMVFRRASIPKTVVQLLAAGALMLLTAFYSPFPLAVQFLVGITVFFGVLLATGALSAQDVSLVVRMIQARAHPEAQES